MKNNKFIILSALLALSAATPAEAQIDAADSAQVNVAFRKVAKEDIMGGVSSINYREESIWIKSSFWMMTLRSVFIIP